MSTLPCYRNKTLQRDYLYRWQNWGLAENWGRARSPARAWSCTGGAIWMWGAHSGAKLFFIVPPHISSSVIAHTDETKLVVDGAVRRPSGEAYDIPRISSRPGMAIGDIPWTLWHLQRLVFNPQTTHSSYLAMDGCNRQAVRHIIQTIGPVSVIK